VSKAAATDEASLMSDSKVVAERFAMVRETDLKGATALPTTATKDLVNAYLMRGETIVTSIDVIAFNNVNGKSMVGRQGVLFITASSQGHHKVKVIMMSETNQVNISESGTRKQSYMGGTEQNLLKQVSTKHTLDGFFSTIDLSKVRDSWRARSPHQHAPPHETFIRPRPILRASSAPTGVQVPCKERGTLNRARVRPCALALALNDEAHLRACAAVLACCAELDLSRAPHDGRRG